MDFRRLRAPLAATFAATALALAGCGTAAPDLAGAWATPEATLDPASPSLPQSPAAAPAASPSAAPSKPAKPAASPTKAKSGRYVFPVGGKPFSYARTHHDYPATDIIANCGLPVRAATDGVILEVSRVDRYDKAVDDGALRGGKFISMLGDDGVRYYNAHLSALGSGINPGVRVRAGQQIGAVGKTGNANNTCHLHFGISPPCARTGDWWVRRGVVWPYTFLDAWRAGTNRSPVSTVAAWKADHGCPRTAP
jgi:murein DD-endopeptidase MepM/ murein hydrolase activator NlpD